MIQKLHISNYAIIDELVIEFSNGLTIITGETGAGKSILMGALGLVLGDRADSNVLLKKDKKSVVEGYFNETDKKSVNAFLLDNDLDTETELVIRREIAPNGKSRAFVNDTPVTLQQLKQLSTILVDLHQQFDTLDLGNQDFQRLVLDALADNNAHLQAYKQAYHSLLAIEKALEQCKQSQAASSKEYDYHKFLYEELAAANLKENELEDLDAELKLLSNAEIIKQELGNISFELNESDQPLVQQIKSFSNRLQSVASFHPGIEQIVKRMQSAQVELQDIGDEIEQINQSVHYSTERMQILNDKIETGYRLLKKHQVHSTAALLSIKQSLSEKLIAVSHLGDTIQAHEQKLQELSGSCEKIAQQLRDNRKKASGPFEAKTNDLLKQVGMPNAQIKIAIAPSALNEYGADSIEYLFDANLPAGKDTTSSRFEPLRKVASGGELSRLMLCVKSLVAKKLQLPTLIFDEIDTGISGEAAKQVGIIMKRLSQSHQLISITHQPQIAARADTHYFVYKAIKGDAIVTSVKRLNNDERITTIAKMLSGEQPTAAALENAKEMLRN